MKRIVAASVLLASCAASNGLDGRSALLNVTAEPPSSACEFGGTKIQSGLDLNSNGNLEPDEVEDTQYVCNGADKAESTLTRASDEPPGDNCEFGGVRIDLGFDTNENGALGDGEVEDTDYVCNGAPGEDGEDGQNGVDGQDGTNGTDGIDGQNGADGQDGVSYLTDLVPVSPNTSCGAVAGVRINSGPDTDGDGTLDAGEVADSELICDGEDGADGTGTGGGTQVVIASGYAESVVTSNAGTDVTVVSVQINAPAAGHVIAFGSTHAYCDPNGTPACATGGGQPTRGYARIINTSTGDPASGLGHSYFFLQDDVTSNIALGNNFTVSGPGQRTYYLRAEAATGQIGFYRSQLNVVFVAD